MTVSPQEVHVHVHIDGLADHTVQLNRMEQMMTTEAAALEELNAKVDALTGDVRALIELFESERDNLSPEGEAKFAEISSKLTGLNEEVGDRDGSEAAPEPDPEA